MHDLVVVDRFHDPMRIRRHPVARMPAGGRSSGQYATEDALRSRRPSLDLVALEERVPRPLARARTSPARSRSSARTASRGSSTRARPPPTAGPACTTCGPGCSRTSTPASRPCGATTCPARAAGTATACPVELEVEKELGPPLQARDRGLRHRRVQPALPRVGAALRRGLGRAHRAVRRVDRHRGRLLDADQRLHRVGLVAGPPDVGQGPALRGPPGRRPTAPAAAPPCRPTRWRQGYRDVVDPSVYVRFPITDGPSRDDADLLVWTTTPWTLDLQRRPPRSGPTSPTCGCRPGRRPRPGHGRGRRGAPLPRGRRCVGHARPAPSWSGGRYQRPFDCLPHRRRRPAGGGRRLREHRRRLGHRPPRPRLRRGRRRRSAGPRACPVLNPVDADGAFDDTRRRRGTGRFVKDADRDIIDDLARPRPARAPRSPTSTATRTAGAAARRSSTGPRRRGSSAPSERRAELLRENERIGWHPEHIKHGRFGKWLEGNVDWALSRDRYWGTPLPIWRCDERPRHLHRLGGRAGRAGRPRPRPTSTCTAPTSTTSRSRARRRLRRHRHAGSRPCSTPGSTRARCRRPSTTTRSRTPTPSTRPFPADFICEAIDQTRGWFYSLLAVNTLVFDATPYRNVVCLGHIVDERRARRCRSRKGNVIDPWHDLRHASAPTRCAGTSSPPASRGRPAGCPRTASARRPARRCSRSGTSSRSSPPTPTSTAGTPTADAGPTPTHVLDRWVLGELDDTVAAVTDALEGFDALGRRHPPRPLRRRPVELVRAPQPAPVLEEPATRPPTPPCTDCLVDHRRSCWPRSARSWPTSSTPRSPASASVHLADWPDAAGPRTTPRLADADGRRPPAGRPRPGRPHRRQGEGAPAARAGRCCCTPASTSTTSVRAEIAAELNVKALEDVDTLVGPHVAGRSCPNFRALGPRLGPKVNEVKAALADGRRLRARSASSTSEGCDRGRRRAARPPTRSRCGPSATRRSPWPRTAAGRWPSTSSSTTTCGPRAPPASWSGRSTTSARSTASTIADRVTLVLDGRRRRWPRSSTAHQAWIAGEVLATELTVGPPAPTRPPSPSTATPSAGQRRQPSDARPGASRLRLRF